jgi:hypothetical protein
MPKFNQPSSFPENGVSSPFETISFLVAKKQTITKVFLQGR